MTPSRETRSTALFLTAAEELAKKVHGLDNPEAKELEQRASALVLIFDSWRTKRPDDDERPRRISELMDLNREVNELITRDTDLSATH